MSVTLPTNAPRARTGKIARLPYHIREEICRRLRDGQPVRAINAWLVSSHVQGAPFSDVNFNSWRKGGYQDWLSDEQRNEQIRMRADTIRRKLDAGGLSVIDEGMYELAQILTDAARERPEDAEKVANAIVGLKLAVVSDGKLHLDKKKVEQREDFLRLQREKFRWQLAEKLIKFAKDASVQSIAARGDVSQEEKIKAILAYMDKVEAEAVTPT